MRYQRHRRFRQLRDRVRYLEMDLATSRNDEARWKAAHDAAEGRLQVESRAFARLGFACAVIGSLNLCYGLVQTVLRVWRG